MNNTHILLIIKTAIAILKILNYIIQEDIKLQPSYSNDAILHMIYSYCYLDAKTLDKTGYTNNLRSVISSNNTLPPISNTDIYLRITADKIFNLLSNMRDDVKSNRVNS